MRNFFLISLNAERLQGAIWTALCFDQILVGALTFFLGRDDGEKKDSDSESEVNHNKNSQNVPFKVLAEAQKKEKKIHFHNVL